MVITIKPRPIFFGQYDISPTAGTATLNIADSYGLLTIAPINGDSIVEDSNGKLGFTITSGGGIYSASLAVAGTATFGAPWTLAAGRNGHNGTQDYFIDNGVLFSYPNLANLSFLSANPVTLYVYPLHDGHVESDETVILTATSVTTNASVTGPVTSNTLTLEITNDDEKAEVSVTAPDNSMAENNSSDSGTFKFQRTGPTTYPLIVPFDFAGTASRALDYTSAFDPSYWGTFNGNTSYYRTITIPAGSSEYSFSILPRNDGVPEPDETAQVVITGGTDFSVTSSSGTATVTIVDDDHSQQTGGHFVVYKQPAAPGPALYSAWTYSPYLYDDGTPKPFGQWTRYKQMVQNELAPFLPVQGVPAGANGTSHRASSPSTMSRLSSIRGTWDRPFRSVREWRFSLGSLFSNKRHNRRAVNFGGTGRC